MGRKQSQFLRSLTKMYTTYHMMIIENPTKMRKVQLMPTMANVQKLISPSSEKTGIQCIPQSSLFRPGKYWGIGMDRFSLSITLCQHFLILTSYNQLAEARHFLRRFWTKPSVSNNFSETQNIYERKCSMFEYQYQYQKKQAGAEPGQAQLKLGLDFN